MSQIKEKILGENRAEILKNRTHSFLEYERYNLVQERVPCTIPSSKTEQSKLQ